MKNQNLSQPLFTAQGVLVVGKFLQKNMVNIFQLFQFRKMFLLQYALEVKLGEKTRLETIIKVSFIKY